MNESVIEVRHDDEGALLIFVDGSEVRWNWRTSRGTVHYADEWNRTLCGQYNPGPWVITTAAPTCRKCLRRIVAWGRDVRAGTPEGGK